MTREFLEKLGLDRSATDAIMAENGKSIEAIKERYAETEAECSALKNEMIQLEKQAEELEKALAESEDRFGMFLDTVIARITSDAGFSSLAAMDSAQTLMREEAADGGDIFAVIDTLRESDPGAFSVKKTEKPYFSASPTAASDCRSDGEAGFIRRRA